MVSHLGKASWLHVYHQADYRARIDRSPNLEVELTQLSELEIAAKAAYEAELLQSGSFSRDQTWDRRPEWWRNQRCRAFAAGLLALQESSYSMVDAAIDGYDGTVEDHVHAFCTWDSMCAAVNASIDIIIKQSPPMKRLPNAN